MRRGTADGGTAGLERERDLYEGILIVLAWLAVVLLPWWPRGSELEDVLVRGLDRIGRAGEGELCEEGDHNQSQQGCKGSERLTVRILATNNLDLDASGPELVESGSTATNNSGHWEDMVSA